MHTWHLQDKSINLSLKLLLTKLNSCHKYCHIIFQVGVRQTVGDLSNENLWPNHIETRHCQTLLLMNLSRNENSLAVTKKTKKKNSRWLWWMTFWTVNYTFRLLAHENIANFFFLITRRLSSMLPSDCCELHLFLNMTSSCTL